MIPGLARHLRQKSECYRLRFHNRKASLVVPPDGLSFSDFSWWLWLLIGVGAFIATISAMDVSCRHKYQRLKILVSVLLGLVALLCIALGYQHFIKWASGG